MTERSNQHEFIKTSSIPGLLVIERPTFRDERGSFREIFRLSELEAIGIKFEAKQWNYTYSRQGVLRGLHAEKCNKLVYPATGRVFIAIVDVRPDSPTFGKFETFRQSDITGRQALFIPQGLAHGFCVTGWEVVDYLYLVDVEYDGSDQTAIAWNDPDIRIPWPIEYPILSKRDEKAPRLRTLFPEKFI